MQTTPYMIQLAPLRSSAPFYSTAHTERRCGDCYRAYEVIEAYKRVAKWFYCYSVAGKNLMDSCRTEMHWITKVSNRSRSADGKRSNRSCERNFGLQ